jgi:hypothetical protein
MDGANPLSEQQREWLKSGIAEFDSGRFWHAHEDWEELWKSLKAEQSEEHFILGIQGMIQCAALLFQYERQNPRGVANMWSKVTEKLGTPEAVKMNQLWTVDISRLLTDLIPFAEDAASEGQPNSDPWGLDATSVKIVDNRV